MEVPIPGPARAEQSLSRDRARHPPSWVTRGDGVNAARQGFATLWAERKTGPRGGRGAVGLCV